MPARLSPDPDWWPDWEGQTVVIVASGPSSKDVPLELAQGRAKVITINTSWKLAPWADILFACDTAWWDQYQGCPEFAGQKLTIERRAAEKWSLGYVHCMKPDDRIFMEPRGTVGWGGNGGFHCLNLAAQMGPRRIVLVGYDMHLAGGSHWHGDHPRGMNNPSPRNIGRWRRAVDNAARVILPIGIEVVNCSPVSALKAYPFMGFEDAVAC